ncbi:hypothetical protein BDZ97DRAFT_1761259 [Flammula alnicola]|nr:hypothetical protein BDZ97DRAFT_1761259 [Flammula alnicola]
MAMPKAPWPSFTLVLSRQNSHVVEDGNIIQRPLDLMKTFDEREAYMLRQQDVSDEDKSDTRTIFEDRVAGEGMDKGKRRRMACSLGSEDESADGFTSDDKVKGVGHEIEGSSSK